MLGVKSLSKRRWRLQHSGELSYGFRNKTSWCASKWNNFRPKVLHRNHDMPMWKRFLCLLLVLVYIGIFLWFD